MIKWPKLFLKKVDTNAKNKIKLIKWWHQAGAIMKQSSYKPTTPTTFEENIDFLDTKPTSKTTIQFVHKSCKKSFHKSPN